jgi:hypothetical protein
MGTKSHEKDGGGPGIARKSRKTGEMTGIGTVRECKRINANWNGTASGGGWTRQWDFALAKNAKFAETETIGED